MSTSDPTEVAIAEDSRPEQEGIYIGHRLQELARELGIRALGGGAGYGGLGRYVARLPAKYAGLTAEPVSTFTMPQGGTATGRPTQWFVDLLRAYDEADDAGELHTQQRHLAKQARVILRALAGVGLVALVHEATGYQAIRAQNELQCRLNALLLPTPAEWQRMWPEPIVASLC